MAAKPRPYPGAAPLRGRNVAYLGYIPSKKGIAECARGPELRAAVTAVATMAIDYAQLIAPSDSNTYVRSFRLDVEVIPDIPFRVKPNPPLPRICATVVNDAPNAILVEVGANGITRNRVLGRTLEWLELIA